MTANDASLRADPSPQRERAWSAAVAFGLLGGPGAWFIQLCSGYPLATWPCFPHDLRGTSVVPGSGWTWPALIAILIAGVLLALGAFLVSWRTWQRSQLQASGAQREALEIGAGRTRFLALWGMIYGAGFAIATLITAVAYIVLPRCAG